MSAPALHITVLAMSMPGAFSDLSHEVRLVKSALLYADSVTLASPKATLLAAIGSLLGAGARERRQAVDQLVRADPDASEVLRLLDELRRRPKGSLGPDALLLRRRLEDQLAKAETQMLQIVERLVSSATADEIAMAVDAGLLDLHFLGVEQGAADRMIQEIMTLLSEVVAPTDATFPMFDDSAGGLLKAMIKDGHVPDARLTAATQAGLAGRYIQTLETFPDAPMDIVLAARRELAQPLIGFRSGISELTTKLVVTPLDDEFQAAADDLYRRDVAPRLEELRHLAEERGLMRLLRREATAMQPGYLSAAGLGLAATWASQMPDLVQAAAATMPLAAGVVGGMRQRREELDGQRRVNRFLWLYEADETLGRR